MNYIIQGGLALAAMGKIGTAITYLGDDIDSADGPVQSVTFSDFAKNSNTGDLIFTSCPTSISRIFTKSMWSHCGIVCKKCPGSTIYEWSSHMASEGLPNSYGDRPFNGTQLVPLDRLAAENGAVYWRPVYMDKSQRNKIKEYIRSAKYKIPFSEYPELAAYLGKIPAKLFNGFGTGMVCSHTVASTYLYAGVLALDRHVSQFSPETFSPSGNAMWNVPICRDIKMVEAYDMNHFISFPQPEASHFLKHTK